MNSISIKTTAALACIGLGLALGARAADPAVAALAAVQDLGRLNGQALACADKDLAAWVKVLMLNHAPKTRAYGQAYEDGTQDAFAAHSRGTPCPGRQASTARLDEVTQRLRTALPAAPPAPASASK
jgi:hypothetical protein